MDAARQELDAIESSREVAEKKLQLLMRKCGIQRLPSSRGGSITAAEEDDDDDEEVDGQMKPDSVDAVGDEDATYVVNLCKGRHRRTDTNVRTHAQTHAQSD